MLHKKVLQFSHAFRKSNSFSFCNYLCLKHLQRQCLTLNRSFKNYFASSSTCSNSNVSVLGHDNHVHGGEHKAVYSILQKWTDRLAQAGVSEPRQSVQLITAHVLGYKMIHEVPVARQVKETEVRKIDELCKRRLAREPLQYIIGEWDFLDLTLEMRRPVFIPRPETETLAELVQADLKSSERNGLISEYRRRKMLEIGCGSGALSIYLLSKLTNLEGVALDVSHSACQLTEDNARRLGVDGRLTVLNMDIQSEIGCLEELSPFDVIISNPPYVPSDEIGALQPEITRYEDQCALDGGREGIDIVQRILSVAPKLLGVDSCIWMEVDDRHPPMIKKLVETHPCMELSYTDTYRDYSQRGRFCQLTRTHR